MKVILPGVKVILLSGGLDSTVLLAEQAYERRRIAPGDRLVAMSVNYGQRHDRELQAAAAVAERLRVRHVVARVDLPLPGSALTDPSVPVPHGHYEAPTMALTVVPYRNLLLLTLAAAFARTEMGKVDRENQHRPRPVRCEGRVYYAAHSGDHAIYADCRPVFFTAMNGVLQAGSEPPRVQVEAPFLPLSKQQIVLRGDAVEAPMDLTWSCYEGGVVHCGRCGTCTERREAFAEAGIADPTTYA